MRPRSTASKNSLYLHCHPTVDIYHLADDGSGEREREGGGREGEMGGERGGVTEVGQSYGTLLLNTFGGTSIATIMTNVGLHKLFTYKLDFCYELHCEDHKLVRKQDGMTFWFQLHCLGYQVTPQNK